MGPCMGTFMAARFQAVSAGGTAYAQSPFYLCHEGYMGATTLQGKEREYKTLIDVRGLRAAYHHVKLMLCMLAAFSRCVGVRKGSL